MGNKRRLLWAALFTLVFAVFLLRSRRVQEPIYRGRPLGYWLYEAPAPLPEKAMAEVSTNAIPWLIEEASAHESEVLFTAKGMINRQSLLNIHIRTASERHKMAEWGLMYLGSAGGMAVAQGLTNANKWVRIGCAQQRVICSIYREICAPSLLKCLDDKDPRVRACAALAVGDTHVDPEKAFPLLFKLLDDPNDGVRCGTALAFYLYGYEARVAIPILTRHLSNSTPEFHDSILIAVKHIPKPGSR